MELALAGLRRNQNVSLHNRLKILEFLDYLETQEVGLPRRIRCLMNLRKFAMIQTDFEEATRKDIEAVLLVYSRLSLADEIKSTFKIILRRFYRWLKDPNDEQYLPEDMMIHVEWNKAAELVQSWLNTSGF